MDVHIPQRMIRYGTAKFPVEMILNLVREGHPRTVFGVEVVKLQSKRLRCFATKGVVCNWCLLKGERFFLEKHLVGDLKYHLSLYGLNKNGDEVLMTRDHIVALADGGSDTLENSQPMCAPCNFAKASVKTRMSSGQYTEGDVMGYHEMQPLECGDTDEHDIRAYTYLKSGTP